MVKKVSKLFVIGLQEALYETHGKMALALNRIAGRAMLKHIEDEELLEITGDTAESLAHDIEDVLEKLDSVEAVEVEETEDEIRVTVVECPFSDAKRALLRRDKVPVVCPFASFILKATEETFNQEMRMKEINVDEEKCEFVMERLEKPKE